MQDLTHLRKEGIYLYLEKTMVRQVLPLLIVKVVHHSLQLEL